MTDLLERGDAVISPCGTYRYALSRQWGGGDRLLWIMLNPSTADATVNDPTITRCMKRAREWGYGQMFVCNLFAFRATDPKVMRKAADPVGPDNDHWIDLHARNSERVVCAWGRHGDYKRRDAAVLARLRALGVEPHCLGDWPRHPLYVPYNVTPAPMGGERTS